MSTLTSEPILGLEYVQREGYKVLYQNLNNRLTSINQSMTTSDTELAAFISQPYVPTTVEAVAPENFYSGHRPSLVNAPIDRYPNCSIWAVRVMPSPENAMLDQISVHKTLLYLEIMVKSAKDEGEVNSRLLRTVEAANVCLLENPTLNGLVHEQDGDPTVNISDVFIRKERTGYGAEWYWQGARIDYTIRKESAQANPSSLSSIFGENPGDPRASMDFSQFIDQG